MRSEQIPDTEIVYWESPIGWLRLSAQGEALSAITFSDKKGSTLTQSPVLQETIRQLNAYFEGSLKAFDLPIQLRGTPFQKQVWAALREIPYGQTVSYKDIARAIGNPSAMRAVGSANGRNPIPIIIPCHRVIAANGTLGGYSSGLWRKKWLLTHEKQNR